VRTAAVLLAAGGGTRFTGSVHKLLAPLSGARVIDHAVRHAIDSEIGPVVVVAGSVELDLDDPAVAVVVNDRWRDGQATSLAVALEAARALDVDSVVLALGDQPFIPAAAWRLVAGASPEHRIVVASYDGRRGPHPVRLHRSLWPTVQPTGDDGARSLLREHHHLVHEVPCPGSAADIDTLEDLHRWTSS
jgi:CTP:molybdopterin cytidylyltransferase MocA